MKDEKKEMKSLFLNKIKIEMKSLFWNKTKASSLSRALSIAVFLFIFMSPFGMAAQPPSSEKPHAFSQSIKSFIGILSRPLLAMRNNSSTYLKQESYLDRPDIMDIPAQSYAFGEKWELFKQSQFSFVAELLEFYSDREIYFLARDSEFLYDTARLVTFGTEAFDRLHLINVSRANLSKMHILDYLEQNGISNHEFLSGKKIVFVDTGFKGTIPETLSSYFTVNENQIKTHLIVSLDKSYPPSSRAFLVWNDREINKRGSSAGVSYISDYENQIPHYTDRSHQFKKEDGVYHPMSPLGGAEDGRVFKEGHIERMADLRATWERSDVKNQFYYERNQIRWLMDILINGDESSVVLLRNRLKELKNTEEGELLEAQLRDLIEAGPNLSKALRFSSFRLFDLRNIEGVHRSSTFSNLLKSVSKNPLLGPVLKSPEAEIPKLFLSKDWDILRDILYSDTVLDNKIIITDILFSDSERPEYKSLIIHAVRSKDTSFLESLLENELSDPSIKQDERVFEHLVEASDSYIKWRLITKTFSMQDKRYMKKALRRLIESIDSDNGSLIQTLRDNVFSKMAFKSTVDIVLERSLDILDAKKRKSFLREQLGNLEELTVEELTESKALFFFEKQIKPYDDLKALYPSTIVPSKNLCGSLFF